MVKECIIFAAGALIGAGTTVLIMRKRYDKKYNELLKDAIKSDADFKLREAEKKLAEIKARESGYIQSSGEEKPSDAGETGEKLQKVDTLNPAKAKSSQEKTGGDKIGKANYVDYTTYYENRVANEYPREEYEKASEEAAYEAERLNEEYHANKGKSPKIVSREEFYSQEYEHHDKVTLYFYKEDQVLATESDEAIQDPSIYIGDALDKFGFRESDEEVIYVRNFGLEIDYEVEKLESAYADAKW